MKISKVEIQAFRIYDKLRDGTFDFRLQDGSPAEFVSIFAPNGFGKTSFYDAVEWALTNKVERISKEKSFVQKDKAGRDVGNAGAGHKILRNKNSTQEPTFVAVYPATGEPIRNTLRKPKRNSTDLDRGIRENAIGFDYLKKTLLEQDAIDAFLRVDDPKNRYREWANKFDDDQLEPYYRTLVNLLSLNEEQMTAAEKRIGELSGRDLKGDPEKLRALNDSVIKLQQMGTKLEPVRENFDEETWLRFVNEVISLISEAEIEEGKEQDRFQHLQVAMTGDTDHIGIRSFLSLPKKIGEKEKEKNVLEERRNLLAELSTLNSANQELKQRFAVLDSHLHEGDELARLYSKYSRIQDSIEKLETKSEAAEVRLNDSTEAEALLTKSIETSKLSTGELQAKLLRINAHIGAFPRAKAELDTLSKEQANRSLEVATLRKYLKELDASAKKTLSTQLEKIRRLESALKERNFKANTSAFDQTVKTVVRELSVSQTAEERIQAEIERINLDIGRHVELATDVEKLVSLGLSIVNSTGQNDCPLCTQEYTSDSFLVKKIEANKLLKNDIRRLNAARRQLTKELSENRASSASVLKRALAMLNELCSPIEAAIEKDDDLKNELQARIRSEEKELSDLSTRIEAVSTRFLGLAPDRYLKGLKQEASKATDELKSANDNLEALLKRREGSREENAGVKTDLSYGKRLMREAKKSQAYQRFLKLCLLAGFELPFNKPMFENEILKLKSEKRVLERDAREMQKRIDKHKQSLAGWTNANKIEDGITRAENDLSGLKMKKDQFEGLLSILDLRKGKKLSHAGLRSLSDESRKTLGEIRTRLALLRSINAMQESVRPFLEHWNNQREIRDLGSTIGKKRSLNGKLSEEKKRIGATIQESVSRFFNEDLINRLYRAIDPHPFYDTIEFQCSFEDKEPTLDVVVRESGKTEHIVPNLYYSTAQINVLSLSIFLARALKATDDDGNPVECIFIDDPVQSMDSINVLSTIDLLRSIVATSGKQLILSTHDENFHNLLMRKIPSDRFPSKFIELETYGRIKRPASA